MGSSEGVSRTRRPGGRCCPSTDEGRGGAQRLDEVGRRKAPEGRGGGRPASGSLVHSTDVGRAPEEMVVVRGQEGMFVEHLQEQITHQATTGERGRTTTRATQDLRDALADMFSLPPLPIPQSSPVRSPSPMAAISTSQSCCDELHHSPLAPSIPATRPHSPESEAGPSKRPITWDLKDPAHPLHRWGMQQA